MAAAWHPWTYTSDDDKSKQVPLPHRPRTWLALPTSAPGLDSPLPHLHWVSAHAGRPLCVTAALLHCLSSRSGRRVPSCNRSPGLAPWGPKTGSCIFRSVGTRCATRKTTSPSSRSKVRTHIHVRACTQMPSSRGRPVAPARFGLQAGDMRCQRRRLWRRLSCCAGWLLASRFSGLSGPVPAGTAVAADPMRGCALRPTLTLTS
jgi:hypothetical protein